jgi:hypothetical protein
MRVPKAAWLAQLRRLEGCAEADIRWNDSVHRWEIVLPSADGRPRSQFWGWFRDANGRRIPPDPATGLHPFRDLDDAAMRELIANLEATYIGNPYNGAGTTQREVTRRYRFNRDLQASKYREAGEVFAFMAQERGRRLRGAPLVSVPVTIGKRQPIGSAT